MMFNSDVFVSSFSGGPYNCVGTMTDLPFVSCPSQAVDPRASLHVSPTTKDVMITGMPIRGLPRS